MTAEKRAAILARVSTDEQAADDKHSLESQVELCRKAAERDGMTVADDHIIATAVSGMKSLDKRPDLLRADLYGRGEVAAIYVMSLDRLARSQVVAIDFEERIAKLNHGDGVRLATLPLASNYHATMVKGVLASTAQYDRTQQSVRMWKGKRDSKKAGLPLGGPAPYGYVRRFEYDERGRVTRKWLEPVEDEAAVVADIFRWYVRDALGLGAIAYRLQERGVAPPSSNRRSPDKHRATTWSAQTVRLILKNPAYKGTQVAFSHEASGVAVEAMRAGEWREPVEIACPQLIEPKTWAEAETRLARRRAMSPRTGNRRVDPWLLQGLVRCAVDGHTFQQRPDKKRKDGTRQRIYVCIGRPVKQSGRFLCENPFRRLDADKLEAALTEQLALLLDAPEKLAASVRRYLDGLSDRIEALRAQMGPTEGEREAVQEELRRLRRAYRAGAYTDAEFDSDERRLRDKLAKLENRNAASAQTLAEYRRIDAERESIEKALAEGRFNAMVAKAGAVILGQGGRIRARRTLRELVVDLRLVLGVGADGRIEASGILPAFDVGREPWWSDDEPVTVGQQRSS